MALIDILHKEAGILSGTVSNKERKKKKDEKRRRAMMGRGQIQTPPMKTPPVITASAVGKEGSSPSTLGKVADDEHFNSVEAEERNDSYRKHTLSKVYDEPKKSPKGKALAMLDRKKESNSGLEGFRASGPEATTGNSGGQPSATASQK